MIVPPLPLPPSLQGQNWGECHPGSTVRGGYCNSSGSGGKPVRPSIHYTGPGCGRQGRCRQGRSNQAEGNTTPAIPCWRGPTYQQSVRNWLQESGRACFVDMVELSCSGIILRHVTHGQEGSSGGQMPNRVNWREVSNPLSYLQCFWICAAVFCEKKSLINGGSRTYQMFLIRKSRRSDGEGWRDYNSIFQQQAASAADLEWAKVNHSLFAVIFLVQSSGRGKACKLDRSQIRCVCFGSSQSYPGGTYIREQEDHPMGWTIMALQDRTDMLLVEWGQMCSKNDGITPALCSLSYTTVEMAAQLVMAQKSGLFLIWRVHTAWSLSTLMTGGC